ncbi:hypothetical protein GOP47_0021309 [Adiantum capillus-veneris]|uniref:Uncharacterized protein n=1 Tax=Adiantum capillus-veneris TaxID=13818 RepID=A0A9D4UAV1_ADICA|nr:hypothetical protein GOP47_0021309 [Adiantum capillus-veneris]
MARSASKICLLALLLTVLAPLMLSPATARPLHKLSGNGVAHDLQRQQLPVNAGEREELFADPEYFNEDAMKTMVGKPPSLGLTLHSSNPILIAAAAVSSSAAAAATQQHYQDDQFLADPEFFNEPQHSTF